MPSSKQKRAEQKRKRRQARKGKVRGGGTSSKAAAARPKRTAAKLDFDPREELGYDPERPLEPEEWLALDEDERRNRVAAFHRQALPPEQRPPNTKLHAVLHSVLETQLALGDPLEAQHALSRLMAEGMSRHEALHAMGLVLSSHLKHAVDALEPLDPAAYAQDLAALDKRSFLRAITG